jgi:hypothetical protein
MADASVLDDFDDLMDFKTSPRESESVGGGETEEQRGSADDIAGPISDSAKADESSSVQSPHVPQAFFGGDGFSMFDTIDDFQAAQDQAKESIIETE